MKKVTGFLLAIAFFLATSPAMAQWGIVTVSVIDNCKFDAFLTHDPFVTYTLTDGSTTRSETQHMDAMTHWVISYADLGEFVSITVDAKNAGGKALGSDEILNHKNECFTPPVVPPTKTTTKADPKPNFKEGNGTFGCEFENLWDLPANWVGEFYGWHILYVKDGEVYLGPIDAKGQWTSGIKEFQYGNHNIAKFQLTIIAGLGGLISDVQCKAVEEKVAKSRCVDCGPAVCLLDQGKFIWNPATQRYLGIVEGKPEWFEHFSEAVAEGLAYAGSECSTCVNSLVNAETIWFGPGSTVEDTANAIAHFIGDNSPTEIEVQMAQAVADEWNKTKPQDGNEYNYQKLFSDKV